MKLKKNLNYFIALVWLANGLFCKVLNLVPRHEQIVAEILGFNYSRILTLAIGVAEIIMTIWILSGYKPKFNAVTQITVIIGMNLLEFILVSELLLWGPLNFLFALLFSLIIYYNEFHLKN